VSAIREVSLGLLKTWTRTTSFIGKDVIETIRRPGALFSLIFGPFLIMGLFGLGYSGQYRPLNSVLVLPTTANLPRDVSFYQQFTGDSVKIVEITDNVERARQRLLRQEIDLIVIAPEDVAQNFLNGQQSIMGIEYNELDPVRDNYARFVAYRQVQELNRSWLWCCNTWE
jgi:ABC-2 type transport system permease protein